jgi:hypothetical protein
MSPEAKVATAFAIPVVLAFLSQAAGYVIALRLRLVYDQVLAEATEAGVFVSDKQPTSLLLPDGQLAIASWVIDASQLLAGVLGPVLGLLVLFEQLKAEVVALFLLAALVTVIGFLRFVGKSDPLTYNRPPRSWLQGRVRAPLGFTPVACIVILANAVCGSIAVALT